MALRQVRKKGDELLRKKARPVGEVTDRIKLLLQDMEETMHKEGGVGIAAPQVGILKRMFIMEPVQGSPEYVIDPEIIKASGEQECEEGCLSVPGVVGTVIRPEKIEVKYTGLDGKERRRLLTEFEAIVFSHEFDHLEGVLFIDKASNIRKAGEE
ncbi:peptide deformylase [Eubacterium saphenum ATCC 49989]|nr:peptide deformylase [Eubacterium saphenum ATCC 49989]